MSTDFITGPVIDKPKPTYIKVQREPKIYSGEPPQTTEGKTPQIFNIQEKCLLEVTDAKSRKKSKCQMKLQVVRVKNQVFEKDDGDGGQLIYDEKDIRQYVVCPVHGGMPLNYDRWSQG